MPTFQARKGYHLSEDGLIPWAHFQPHQTDDGYVYLFRTEDPSVIERLGRMSDVKEAPAELAALLDAPADDAPGPAPAPEPEAQPEQVATEDESGKSGARR